MTTIEFFLLSLHYALPISVHNFFFFNDTATTEIYTLSLHDALPISSPSISPSAPKAFPENTLPSSRASLARDRKSTRLNSSHTVISYAVFCLKKKSTSDRKSTRLNSSHANISYAVFCLTNKKTEYSD